MKLDKDKVKLEKLRKIQNWGKLEEIDENWWKLMKIDENWWKLMKFNEN